MKSVLGTFRENYWNGLDDYVRNYGIQDTRDNGRRKWFAKIVALYKPKSVLELGCNVGTNLRYIQRLDPSIKVAGDANPEAIEYAKSVIPEGHFECGSVYDAADIFKEKFDLVFSMGVLIHIPDDMVDQVREQALALSKETNLHCEEHSQSPEIIRYKDAVPYRRSHDYRSLYKGAKIYNYIAGAGAGAQHLIIAKAPSLSFGQRIQLWYLCVSVGPLCFWFQRLRVRMKARGIIHFFVPTR